MPEGTIVCNVEGKMGDRGSFARGSGTSAVIIGHTDDGKTTRVKLPSGQRKALKGSCRAMVGICAGGQRGDKPLLKAVNSWYRQKAKRNHWPRVRGVAMNPVEHPLWWQPSAYRSSVDRSPRQVQRKEGRSHCRPQDWPHQRQQEDHPEGVSEDRLAPSERHFPRLIIDNSDLRDQATAPETVYVDCDLEPRSQQRLAPPHTDLL